MTAEKPDYVSVQACVSVLIDEGYTSHEANEIVNFITAAGFKILHRDIIPVPDQRSTDHGD